MDAEGREKMWVGLGRLDMVLSLSAAIIEIGLFFVYLASVIKPEIVLSTGLLVLATYFGQDSIRKRHTIKSSVSKWSMAKSFPALASFLNATPNLPKEYRIDDRVLYEEVLMNYEIDGADALFSKRVIGEVVSDEELERTFYTTSGETSIENGRIHPKALRRLEEGGVENLESKVVFSASNVKVVGVDLNPPISRGGRVDVTFSTRWLGAFVSRYGYVFASISHCVKGVRKLAITVSFKDRVTKCSIWTWDLNRNELKELEKVKNPTKNGGRYTINWQRTDPEINKIYIVRYRRHGTMKQRVAS